MKHPRRIILQRVHLVDTEERVIPLDMLFKPLSEAEEIQYPENSELLDIMGEDIAYHTTLQIPAITLVSERHIESGQHQVLTKAASSAAIAGVGDIISAVLRYL